MKLRVLGCHGGELPNYRTTCFLVDGKLCVDGGAITSVLELEEILQEQILLTLPMQRVCSETCKGICPGCGKNRNESACDCKPVADDRWGALRKLQL